MPCKVVTSLYTLTVGSFHTAPLIIKQSKLSNSEPIIHLHLKCSNRYSQKCFITGTNNLWTDRITIAGKYYD